RRWTYLRDHEPDAPGDRQGVHGRRRHDGSRPGLRALDPPLPRGAAAAGLGCGRRGDPRGHGTRAARGWAPEARTESSMTDKDALVVFTPSGKRARFPLGTPLLQAARGP